MAIGASAGGLEALTAILRALPTDIAMAFMLIQHLDPKRHSILPELLSKVTRIPVLEAIDAMKIESNRIYVMPSNVDISIMDGYLGLMPRIIDRKQHLPIDIFMQSLAEVRKSRAIGVILSGTASDGTAGVEAIRAKGGVTFAQDPDTAKFDGMPRSAIESGCIDFVLSPEKIAAELSWMSTHPTLRRKSTDLTEDPKDDDYVFNSILILVSTSQGADFSKYKPNTIHRRTQQRMAALKIASLAAYLTYLGEHQEEVANLSNHVLIPVTEFFRNPEVFDDLTSTIYPAIVGEKGKETIRIWVVACSEPEKKYIPWRLHCWNFLVQKPTTSGFKSLGRTSMRRGCEGSRRDLLRQHNEDCFTEPRRKVFYESGRRLPGQQGGPGSMSFCSAGCH